MLRTATISLLLLGSALTLTAQHADLIIFAEDGEKFTLTVDGVPFNETPMTRVAARGIRNETPMLVITFEEKAFGSIKKGGYFPAGKEYTMIVKKNNKGAYVLRGNGEAALGTTEVVSASSPAPLVDDATSTQQTVQQTTMTTTQQIADGEMNSTNGMQMSIGVNENVMNMNMQVNDDGPQGSSASTTTTTMNTTTTVTQAQAVEDYVEHSESDSHQVLAGGNGCASAMAGESFNEAKMSLQSKGFEDSKLTLAKQIVRRNCLSSAQVRDMMNMFSFEDSKLDFAKFAFDFTFDNNNFNLVNDAFGFESSVEELNEYLSGR